MAYYIGGFTWEGESQLDRFISEGIWQNGYGEDRYKNLFNNIQIGDFFALKSTFVQGGKSWLKIVKVGIIKGIIDSSTIKIDWSDIPEFRLTDIRWYANTLEKIEDKAHIKLIFRMVENKGAIMDLSLLLQHKKQIILQGAPGTGKTYIAKDIAEQLIFEGVSSDKNVQADRLKTSEYFKLVQFHPSYTYEDFVRGIEVKTLNGQAEYISKNKVLGEFAKEARKNWDLYNLEKQDKAKEVIKKESKFDQFIDSIQQEIDETGKYPLTKNIYLFEYDDIRFKYKGDNWEAHFGGLNMKYSELRKVLDTGLTERSEIKKTPNIESLTASHATYYTKMAEEYSSFKSKPVSSPEPILQKSYILIIDEINRANLPAVLGELIYALEYRGEKVESMYAVDGDRELVLPPNLYVIGTMNTADRSVGQIDYAIRRRFAFVNMLPKVLTDEPDFDIVLFKKISAFFIENIEEYITNPNVSLKKSEFLSDEFLPEDVWIGHSYFIIKDDNREMRLNYEIKPILREYLKDGILKENVNGKDTKAEINNL